MLFKGLVLFFLLFGICNGETCKCFTYIVGENELSDENRISELEYELDNLGCDDDGSNKCKEFCEEMYRDLTDNGRTCHQIPEDDRRVADWMCEELNRDVCDVNVGGFSQICEEKITNTGFRFTDTLCCKEGHSLHC